jgi:hypothetical protein
LTGKGPTSVRWVDVNKADEGGMEVRCRLVARDFRGADRGRDDLFAATPPLEAKRMLLSRAATRNTVREPRKLLFIDAKKAHLNPRCMQDVFIELPEECGAAPGVCGKLNHWLMDLDQLLRPGRNFIQASSWDVVSRGGSHVRWFSTMLRGIFLV